MKENNNNKVSIIGVIKEESVVFNHEVYGEKFYRGLLSVERASGILDEISFLVSERLVNNNPTELEGKLVHILGSYRSNNKRIEGSTHAKLELNIFVDEINDDPTNDEVNNTSSINNKIELIGYICKESTHRYTPLGREICDLLLAVNRAYGKSDYIPCITWGRNAKYSSNLKVGDRVEITGRIQSRIYIKNDEERIAYEVSVSKITKLSEGESDSDETYDD